jgi:hypothetical protein
LFLPEKILLFCKTYKFLSNMLISLDTTAMVVVPYVVVTNANSSGYFSCQLLKNKNHSSSSYFSPEKVRPIQVDSFMQDDSQNATLKKVIQPQTGLFILKTVGSNLID